MVLSMLSGFIPGQKAYAADSSKKTGKTVVETEIDESTYKALGLSTDIDKSKAAVPYDKDNISTFAEVRYTLRQTAITETSTLCETDLTGLEISRTGLQR